MIFAIADKYLHETTPEFLVFGYKSDGKRGIPASYEQVAIPCSCRVSVLKAIDSLADFRVFSLSEEGTSVNWKTELAQLKADLQDKEERDQYEKLKAKFER